MFCFVILLFLNINRSCALLILCLLNLALLKFSFVNKLSYRYSDAAYLLTHTDLLTHIWSYVNSDNYR